MRDVFDDEALDDLRQIFEWISKDSPGKEYEVADGDVMHFRFCDVSER